MWTKRRAAFGACFFTVILAGICSSVLCYYVGVGRCELFHLCDDVLVKTEAIHYLERSLDNQSLGLRRQTRVERVASLRDMALSSAKSYISRYDTQLSEGSLVFIREAQ